jgi:hypothetical protein
MVTRRVSEEMTAASLTLRVTIKTLMSFNRIDSQPRSERRQYDKAGLTH